MPEIDLCLGTNEKKDIISYVEDYCKNNRKNQANICDDVFKNNEYGDFGSVTYTEKIRAVIKVQDGCDRFCSYCLIPYARGRVRSRKPESVMAEIKEIASKGIKEVVITGIHVASYGKDFAEDYGLIDLLEDIHQIEGIARIRLGSIEPLLINDEFLKRLRKLDKICHHFHLSLQSGCTQTLQRMNRRYTTQQFEEIVQKLRNIYSDVILTTDIIVGFPGETDEEFEETYQFLEKIKFYKMHIFKYSIRTGTKAAVIEDQVSNDLKECRSKRLLQLSVENQKFYHEQYRGKKVEILVEEKEEGYYKGHTANYLLVKVKAGNLPNLENQMLMLKPNQFTQNELVVEM